MNTIMSIVKRFVNWIENGDLIPTIIAVSVPHYARVLAQYDFWAVAAIIGFLVDIGHYRTIKTYLRGNGWGWMVVLTVFSVGFHMAFYVLGGAGGWSIVLGCAIPVVIFALAFISRREKLDTKVSTSVKKDESAKVVPMAQIGNAIGVPIMPMAKRGTYTEFISVQVARDGNGPMSAGEVVAQFGVPKRTAYNWISKYAAQSKPVPQAQEAAR